MTKCNVTVPHPQSCHECNVKGATVGCEVKKCKRTYHYPCARKDGAEIIEDRVNGTYKLVNFNIFFSKHVVCYLALLKLCMCHSKAVIHLSVSVL